MLQLTNILGVSLLYETVQVLVPVLRELQARTLKSVAAQITWTCSFAPVFRDTNIVHFPNLLKLN